MQPSPLAAGPLHQRQRALQVAWRARNRERIRLAQRARKQRSLGAGPAQPSSTDHVVTGLYQRVSALLSPPQLDVDTWTASRPTVSDDVKDAAAMTTCISNHIPLHVCAAVCGVYRRGLVELQHVPATQLPMQLLRADGPGIY